MLDVFSTATVVVLATQDGHQAATADGTHTTHMVNMEHIANPLHNKLPTPATTKSLADNSAQIERQQHDKHHPRANPLH